MVGAIGRRPICILVGMSSMGSTATVRTVLAVETTSALREFCRAHAAIEPDVLRTAFAVLLAAHSGKSRVQVVTACVGLLGPTALASIQLDARGTLLEAAKSWTQWQAG